METYLKRFEKMVAELQSHPKIQVSNYHCFAPASDEQIERVETILGYELHSSIKNFYRQSNGLQLVWIFTSNEQFDENLHMPNGNPLDFSRQYQDYFPEDGAVMIQPIEEAFLSDWKERIFFDFMNNEEIEKFGDKEYGCLDFHQRIRPFDAFSMYYDMAFFLDGTGNPPVIMGNDHQACYTDSLITDFESYMEFVLANKAAISRRNGFYNQYAGHKKEAIITPHSYFSKEKILDIDTFLLKDIFPLSDKAGSSTTGLKTSMMQQMAESSQPINKAQIKSIIEKHHQFLASGGAGGKWQTINISGLVHAVYIGSKNGGGEQAIFEMKHLPPRLDLVESDLPFANFCGCFAKRLDFSESDLSYSIITDAVLDETIFADANLSGVDFSRSSLRKVSFMNANLQGADFENCDLTGADFRGCNLEGSRFPGAILKGVKM